MYARRRGIVIGLLVGMVACAGNPPPDTSQLSAQGRRDLQRLNVIKVVNDVSSAVIAANTATDAKGQPLLSDTATAKILTVNKQVLDVIAEDPQGYRSQAISIVRNTRDALPAAINALIEQYLSQIEAVLNEVRE